MAKFTGSLYTLSYFLAVSADIMVLCGLAGLQNVCHTNGPVVNSLQLADGNTCSKAYRFEWWGFALESAFLLLLAINWVTKKKNIGTMMVGVTSTVLAMIFANNFLFAVDALRGKDTGKDFSRATLTFIGFMLVAVFNYFLFLLWDSKPAEPATKPAEPQPAAAPVGAATAV